MFFSKENTYGGLASTFGICSRYVRNLMRAVLTSFGLTASFLKALNLQFSKTTVFLPYIFSHSESNKIVAGKVKVADSRSFGKILHFIRGKIELVRVRAESYRNARRNLCVAAGNCKFRRLIRAAIPLVRDIFIIPEILADPARVIVLAKNITRNEKGRKNKYSGKKDKKFFHIAILYFYKRRIYTA